MKRFYTQVDTAPAPGGFTITLDGKPVLTPSRQPLVAPNLPIAALAAEEWRAQQGDIKPDTMPVTQILTTICDHGADLRQAVTDEILGYLNTDLLCYRAPDTSGIAARQAAAWDPWLRWFEKRSGVMLQTTAGLSALVQDRSAHAFARDTVQSFDIWHFTAVQMVTALSGSLVLALAFVAGDAGIDDVFAAAHVEEDYRAEIYHEDLHGMAPQQEKERASKMRDLKALRAILDAAAKNF